MRTKGYKCSNIKCNSCVARCICGECGDIALNCSNRIIAAQTNGDRIRAMTDEEFVKELNRHFDCPPIQSRNCPDIPCDECWLNWLKQPAKEDT